MENYPSIEFHLFVAVWLLLGSSSPRLSSPLGCCCCCLSACHCCHADGQSLTKKADTSSELDHQSVCKAKSHRPSQLSARRPDAKLYCPSVVL